jgi:putative addiction module killer protein
LEATPREILLYETEDSRVPFSEWMDGLEGQPIYASIMARLGRVEQGNLGDHRSVGEGVSEFRFDVGPGYRVYFGQDGDFLVVLLVGGTKGTQRSDIRKAQEYWRNYNA